MKYLITEEQYKKFLKSSPALQNGIVKYLTYYISNGNRKIGKKSRNYGNLREDWCVDGKEVITAIYRFTDDNRPDGGNLFVSSKLVETLMSSLSVKKSFIIHTIEEWYEDVMIPKIEEITGESGLYFTNIHLSEKEEDCIPEVELPEDITDEEMMDFIEDNTLYQRKDIIDNIESGERDLEDFYLDVVEIVNRRNR